MLEFIHTLVETLDKYFENVGRMLTTLSARGYTYQGERARLDPRLAKTVAVGDAEVGLVMP